MTTLTSETTNYLTRESPFRETEWDVRLNSMLDDLHRSIGRTTNYMQTHTPRTRSYSQGQADDLSSYLTSRTHVRNRSFGGHDDVAPYSKIRSRNSGQQNDVSSYLSTRSRSLSSNTKERSDYLSPDGRTRYYTERYNYSTGPQQGSGGATDGVSQPKVVEQRNVTSYRTVGYSGSGGRTHDPLKRNLFNGDVGKDDRQHYSRSYSSSSNPSGNKIRQNISELDLLLDDLNQVRQQGYISDSGGGRSRDASLERREKDRSLERREKDRSLERREKDRSLERREKVRSLERRETDHTLERILGRTGVDDGLILSSTTEPIGHSTPYKDSKVKSTVRNYAYHTSSHSNYTSGSDGHQPHHRHQQHIYIDSPDAKPVFPDHDPKHVPRPSTPTSAKPIYPGYKPEEQSPPLYPPIGGGSESTRYTVKTYKYSTSSSSHDSRYADNHPNQPCTNCKPGDHPHLHPHPGCPSCRQGEPQHSHYHPYCTECKPSDQHPNQPCADCKPASHPHTHPHPYCPHCKRGEPTHTHYHPFCPECQPIEQHPKHPCPNCKTGDHPHNHHHPYCPDCKRGDPPHSHFHPYCPECKLGAHHPAEPCPECKPGNHPHTHFHPYCPNCKRGDAPHYHFHPFCPDCIPGEHHPKNACPDCKASDHPHTHLHPYCPECQRGDPPHVHTHPFCPECSPIHTHPYCPECQRGDPPETHVHPYCPYCKPLEPYRYPESPSSVRRTPKDKVNDPFYFPPTPSKMSPGSQRPPKKVDELMATLGEPKFPLDIDSPRSTPVSPVQSSPSPKMNGDLNLSSSPETIPKRLEAEADAKAKAEARTPTRNRPGPPVYYPPGHVMFAQKEEMQGKGAYGEGYYMKEKSKGKYKSKSKASESKSGAIVPVCLPLCCAAPVCCTII